MLAPDAAILKVSGGLNMLRNCLEPVWERDAAAECDRILKIEES